MKSLYKLVLIFMAVTMIFLTGCTNDEKAMVEAVKNGDTAKVQSLLDKGVSPNLKTDDGQTVLMLASYLGHGEVAQLLIDKGADVNAKDNNGTTALMFAAEKGNIEMAKLLLEKGADLNTTDNNGKTALQIAQENNQTEMVEFLSNWGKPVSTPTPEETPTPTPTETPVPTITGTPTPTLTPTSTITPTVTATPTVSPTVTPTPIPTDTPTPVASPTHTPVVNANQHLASILFDFDKSVLRTDQTGTMENNLAVLKENPDLYIILGGHADERGTREYNQKLSERRAGTIKKYLIEHGVNPDRIIVYAYGKDYPLKKGKDEASLRYNRRVDILEWETILTRDQFIDETVK